MNDNLTPAFQIGYALSYGTTRQRNRALSEIREAMREGGSQVEMAERIGVGVATFRRWLKRHESVRRLWERHIGQPMRQGSGGYPRRNT